MKRLPEIQQKTGLRYLGNSFLSPGIHEQIKIANAQGWPARIVIEYPGPVLSFYIHVPAGAEVPDGWARVVKPDKE